MLRSLSAACAATLLLTALAPAPAQARRLRRMSDEELIQVLCCDEDEDRREDAAELLGDREVEAAVEALTNAVIHDSEIDVQVEALDSLEDIESATSIDAVAQVFSTAGLPERVYQKSLRILLEHDRYSSTRGIGQHLARYRAYDPDFQMQLLRAVEELALEQVIDLPLLMLQDGSLRRRVRLKALDVLEALNHPALHLAFVELLDDDEKRVKIRCIRGLSRSGLPPQMVSEALQQVVRTDSQGDVRAAAMNGLKLYAHPDLLPLVHHSVLNERHIGTAAHAYMLFVALADQSSLSTLQQLQARDLPDDTHIQLNDVALRLGDPAMIPVLTTLAGRTESPEVQQSCWTTIELLRNEQQLVVWKNAWVPPAEVIVYEVSEPWVEYQMSVKFDDAGHVVYSDGSELIIDASVPGMNVRIEVND